MLKDIMLSTFLELINELLTNKSLTKADIESARGFVRLIEEERKISYDIILEMYAIISNIEILKL